MIVHWLVNGVRKDEKGAFRSELASNRYRAILPATALRDLGHTVDLIDMQTWTGTSCAGEPRPDVLVVGKFLPDQNNDFVGRRLLEGVCLAQQMGIKVIADVNDDHFQNPAIGWYWAELVRQADGTVAASQAMAEVVAQYTQKPIYVVGDPVAAPLGVPKTFQRITGWRALLQNILQSMGYSAPRLRLAWFGHPVNWPSMASWIPSLVKLAEKLPWSLQVITRAGFGIEHYIFGFMAACPRGAMIEFVPWSEPEIWQYVQDAHMVLIPSDVSQENKRVKSTNRLVDALYCGCFVVASPLPAYMAFTDCAWLGDNPAAGIEWAVEHPMEVSKKIQVGQKRIAEAYSPTAVAKAWIEVFEQLGAHQNSPRARSSSSKDSECAEKVKINLGCGDKILPGYINVDVAYSRSGKKPNIVCDVRRLGCFAEKSADELLAVHVIEHFWRWEVEDILREWLRILKPGGQLILECPNLISACQLLAEDPSLADETDTRVSKTMWVLYGDPAWKDPLMCHRWGYTPRSLKRLLEYVGYVNVRQEPAQYKMREPRDMRIVGERKL